MPLPSIRAWLGLDDREEQTFAPLRETLDALDHLEPERARYLAAFAYLLGRVAHADQHVSPEETRTMESLVREHGQLSEDQAMVVVQLAKSSNRLFGGTANFLVAREFSALATYDQKLALLRCLFALSAAHDAISTAEEGEIHRIAQELRVDRPDLIPLRLEHQRHLPGLSVRGARHPHASEEERAIREAALDRTIENSFPASDPPSTNPNPHDDSLGAPETPREPT